VIGIKQRLQKGGEPRRHGEGRRVNGPSKPKNRKAFMIKKITIIAGLLLSAAGFLGFLAPNFMGLSLSSGQSILYLVTGAAALYFGLFGQPAPTRMFCILFGSFYAFLGAAGLGLGGPRLTIIPGQLVFETLDHLFHLILGAIVLAVALSGRMANSMGFTESELKIKSISNERKPI
jgi:hypothetical protein